MYSYNEKRQMNLGDCYTMLYGYIVQSMLEEHGEKGEKAAREGTRRFGVDRAMVSREKHLAAGAKINMLNLFTLFHDLPGDPRFRRELQEINPQERVSHTLICPMADTWKAHGHMAIGRIYCEEFHFACYNTYAYGYTHVNLAKTLTQEGDEYCAFNIVLRPENLPEELKPLCFEEYDPLYETPVYPEHKVDAKKGFGILSVKLYFHLLKTAVEQLGESGAKSAEKGLENFARAVAKLMKNSAAAYGRAIDDGYLAENVPIDMDTVIEPIWNQYGDCEARERMQRHFCDTLLREVKIS